MLFNSYVFLFFFLPVCLLVCQILSQANHKKYVIPWLIVSSLFFYAWWHATYLFLIIFSIIFNYALSLVIKPDKTGKSRFYLILGISGNLAALAWFKYAGFLVALINDIFSTEIQSISVVLPLAISFFTFQQIAYLVDKYKNEAAESTFVNYCFFVSFFPQLIAGPIVHHKEIFPQLDKIKRFIFDQENISVGITIFTIGLFKKTVLADSAAIYADPVFYAAEQGVTLSFFEAWCGTLAYTFQLYFDFSGYSDMAIGLARIFGIRLPVNFYSPYKATSIIEFWRRWHITLSRFLRDYLYIPLGGNRKGKSGTYLNIMITMFLGGLWHGAGLNFIIWGMLHGVYLVTNHLWIGMLDNMKLGVFRQTKVYKFMAWVLTFMAVVFGWAMFRAESLDGACEIMKAMAGGNGISLQMALAPYLAEYKEIINFTGIVFNGLFVNELVDWKWSGIVILLIMLIIVVLFPNTQQIMIKYNPVLETRSGNWPASAMSQLLWKPARGYAVMTGLALLMAVLMISRTSEFLYFQF